MDENERIDRYKHVGKLMGVFDLRGGVSPFIRILLNASADPEEVAKALTERVIQAFTELPGVLELEWTFKAPEILVHAGTGPIMPKEMERKAWDEAIKPLRKDLNEQGKERLRALKDMPKQTGYWLVEGIRHTAVVKASSALIALQKASDHVQSWESPDASFLGEELPEVFCL